MTQYLNYDLDINLTTPYSLKIKQSTYFSIYRIICHFVLILLISQQISSSNLQG